MTTHKDRQEELREAESKYRASPTRKVTVVNKGRGPRTFFSKSMTTFTVMPGQAVEAEMHEADIEEIERQIEAKEPLELGSKGSVEKKQKERQEKQKEVAELKQEAAEVEQELQGELPPASKEPEPDEQHRAHLEKGPGRARVKRGRKASKQK